MALTFANNAISILAADITAIATTLTVRSGDGALFPVTGTNTFNITVQDSTGNFEIMLCTSRTTDSFTVTRAQESTTARAFSAGATVENRFTAGTMSTYARTANVQPLDATLTALAGVTTAANKVIYATGADAFSTTTLSSAGRALIDDADAAAQRTTLGVVIGTDVQAYDADTVKKDAVNGYTKQQYATVVALTGQSGSVAVDASDYQDVSISATGDITFGAPSNSVAGAYITMTLYAASALTLTWNSAYKANADVALPTAFVAGKRMILSFRCYDGTNWLLMGKVQEA